VTKRTFRERKLVFSLGRGGVKMQGGFFKNVSTQNSCLKEKGGEKKEKVQH